MHIFFATLALSPGSSRASLIVLMITPAWEKVGRQSFLDGIYTITYKSRLTQKKNGTKKPMLFLISMGKMGLSHDIFFKFSVRSFEVVEVK